MTFVIDGIDSYHDGENDLFGHPPAPERVELSSFLPLSLKPSLVGQIQIVDRNGATFVDRAYQMRGFAIRESFRDEWADLAPQLIAAINGFGPAKEAIAEALKGLRGICGAKLPAKDRRALASALEVLAKASS